MAVLDTNMWYRQGLSKNLRLNFAVSPCSTKTDENYYPQNLVPNGGAVALKVL